MTLAHISDLHFGRIAHPGIVQALVDEVNDGTVDVVAISGDLTQRARHREFRAAQAMLDAIEPPLLVVPGNHDVHPWWKPFRRLRRPLGRYRDYVGDDLTPVHRQNGVTILGVNSAFGQTVKGGRITDVELDAIERTFGADGNDQFGVLVLHHHLAKIQALGWHDVVRRAEETLTLTASVGVDLVLCGHLHISHVETLVVRPHGQRLVIASAGTATSDRGRKSNRSTNFYNRIAIRGDDFSIEERRYDPRTDAFVSDGVATFDRDGVFQANG